MKEKGKLIITIKGQIVIDIRDVKNTPSVTEKLAKKNLENHITFEIDLLKDYIRELNREKKLTGLKYYTELFDSHKDKSGYIDGAVLKPFKITKRYIFPKRLRGKKCLYCDKRMQLIGDTWYCDCGNREKREVDK